MGVFSSFVFGEASLAEFRFSLSQRAPQLRVQEDASPHVSKWTLQFVPMYRPYLEILKTVKWAGHVARIGNMSYYTKA